MKLIRLVHKNIAHFLEKDLMLGCSLYQGCPFFYGFDAVAAAIIESPVYSALGEIPPTILAVEYTVPENSLQVVDDTPIYGDYTVGNHYLGKWVDRFLKSKVALVAAYPSKHWARQQNYIINPKHELFREVEITDIRSIYR